MCIRVGHKLLWGKSKSTIKEKHDTFGSTEHTALKGKPWRSPQQFEQQQHFHECGVVSWLWNGVVILSTCSVPFSSHFFWTWLAMTTTLPSCSLHPFNKHVEHPLLSKDALCILSETVFFCYLDSVSSFRFLTQRICLAHPTFFEANIIDQQRQWLACGLIVN